MTELPVKRTRGWRVDPDIMHAIEDRLRSSVDDKDPNGPVIRIKNDVYFVETLIREMRQGTEFGRDLYGTYSALVDENSDFYK